MPSAFMPNGMVPNHSSAGSLFGPVLRRTHERLDCALGGGVEAREREHDLAAGADLDPKPAPAHLVDHPVQQLT